MPINEVLNVLYFIFMTTNVIFVLLKLMLDKDKQDVVRMLEDVTHDRLRDYIDFRFERFEQEKRRIDEVHSQIDANAISGIHGVNLPEVYECSICHKPTVNPYFHLETYHPKVLGERSWED